MGLMSRRKGANFERKIANVLREQFPQATWYRASQADRAHNPDVYAQGGGGFLDDLWLELNDAREPNPERKLVQAERDARASKDITGLARRPIVIWHRIGERSTQATMRLHTLARLAYGEVHFSPEIVTMDLGSFLRLVEGAISRSA